MAEKRVGEVTHYYKRIGVAIVKVTGTLKVGDTIHIKGPTTDFEQQVESMEIEHEPIEAAKKGDLIGLKVNEKVRDTDAVYLVE